ncbi:MAG: isocitrate lyase/PEP mutase family protein [Magnetococcales bacterium]|nr:isocitrate lyase/PEP mutase family protein [Magnetococcales bacterium]
MTPSQTLHHLLQSPGFLVGPGVYDCLSARIAQRAGFPLLFSSGFGIAAATLGVPDIGLLTATEMLTAAGNIARAVGIPLIADMDTGYGSPLNVIRTVEEAIARDIAGVILEDQQWPKRCGHMAGKSVIALEEHVAKIRAAHHARRRRDALVIVARTDARAPCGLEEALRRGRAYFDAGADLIFVEAPESEDELRRIPQALPGIPLLVNVVEGGRTPPLPFESLAAMGFKLGVLPLSGLFEATQALETCFQEIRRTGATRERAVAFENFKEIVGTADYRALEEQLGTAAADRLSGAETA